MKMINLIQGGESWKQFRKGKIGASMAGTILGVNFYETPLQLWNRLLEEIEVQDNPFMKRGRELEPKAREWLNNRGFEFKPVVVQHDKYNWMVASLDGFDGEMVCEIKCPSKILSEISEDHYAQVQHQLAVTGVHEAIYLQFDGENGIMISVTKNEDYIADLIEKERVFYDCLVNFRPPAATERDVLHINSEKDVVRFTNLKNLDAHIKMLEKEFAALKKEVIADITHPIVECTGIRLTKIMRKGSVDYDVVPELQGVNLDKYRKSAIESWRLSYGD